MIRYNTIRYDAIRYDLLWYGTIRCDTMRANTCGCVHVHVVERVCVGVSLPGCVRVHVHVHVMILPVCVRFISMHA